MIDCTWRCKAAHASAVALVVGALLSMAGCGDDPPTDQDPPANCGGACGPGLVCDESVNQCVPVGGDTGDTGEDAGDAGGDIDEEDSADAVEDRGEDTAEDVQEDVVEDVVEDVPEDTADTNEAGEDAADLSDATDVGDEGDVADEPDVQDAADGGDSDVAEVEADIEPDLGPEICPDPREGEGGNDTLETATLLGEVVTGSIGVRGTADREVHSCGDLSFVDQGGASRCQSDVDCECELVEDLGACGSADPDFHEITLVAVDTVFVHVGFHPPFSYSEVDAVLIGPASETACAGETCGEDEACHAGFCHPVVEGVWVDADRSGSNESIELVMADVLSDAGGLVSIGLLVTADAEAEVGYDVLAQVDPSGRACLHDDWDADWDAYDAEEEESDGCTDDSCTLPAAVSTEFPWSTGENNICEWDHQDFFRHIVDGDTPVERMILVQWDPRHGATVNAELFVDAGGSLTSKGGFQLVDSGVLRAVFCSNLSPLQPGTYHVRVDSDRPVEVEVDVFSDILTPHVLCAD